MHKDTVIDGSRVSLFGKCLGYGMGALRCSFHHFLLTSKLEYKLMSILCLCYLKTLILL
jgi:hypothetical protein